MKARHLLARLICCIILFSALRANAAAQVVVGSKKFPENALLGEVLAQLLEARGIAVERRLNMGNTAIVFESLKSGVIDIYPEYTGTVLSFTNSINTADTGALATRRASEKVLAALHLRLGAPLGFNNTYALATGRTFAEKHNLHSISDLARLSQRRGLRSSFTHEFLARVDGWPALSRAYGLKLAPRGAEHGLAYELLGRGEIDVMEVYATEGRISAHELRVLKDDAAFFPRYDAAYLLGPNAQTNAHIWSSVSALAGRFNDERMRGLNHQVEVQHLPISEVASSFLRSEGLVTSGDSKASVTRSARTAIVFADLWGHVLRHLWLVLVAVLFSILIGIPLGVVAAKSRVGRLLAVGGSGVLQTIPSLALLVFMIPLGAAVLQPVGAGRYVMEVAAVAALVLYSLLPVIRNTQQGLSGVPESVVDAARGLGMTERQLLVNVTLPLALPVVFAGIRTAATIAMGTATLAAFIGAGGLGVPIISGLAVQDYNRVYLGAGAAAVLALLIDWFFALVQRALQPRLGSG